MAKKTSRKGGHRKAPSGEPTAAPDAALAPVALAPRSADAASQLRLLRDRLVSMADKFDLRVLYCASDERPASTVRMVRFGSDEAPDAEYRALWIGRRMPLRVVDVGTKLSSVFKEYHAANARAYVYGDGPDAEGAVMVLEEMAGAVESCLIMRDEAGAPLAEGMVGWARALVAAAYNGQIAAKATVWYPEEERCFGVRLPMLLASAMLIDLALTKAPAGTGAGRAYAALDQSPETRRGLTGASAALAAFAESLRRNGGELSGAGVLDQAAASASEKMRTVFGDNGDARSKFATADVSADAGFDEQTRPVSLTYAAKEWFGMKDHRALRDGIASGAYEAKRISPKLYVFDLAKVPPHATMDADPERVANQRTGRIRHDPTA